MSQDLFAFDNDEPPAAPELSLRELAVEQIRRDFEALKDEDSPWWQEFFRGRIGAYRTWAKELQ